MPLRIPKVLNDDDRWTDLYEQICQDHVLFLTRPLTDEVRRELQLTLLAIRTTDSFRSKDTIKDVSLYVNSSSFENSIIGGLTLVDTMQYVPHHVRTINYGIAISINALVVRGGEIGKRIVHPHARFNPWIPVESFMRQGQALDYELETREQVEIREKVIRKYWDLEVLFDPAFIKAYEKITRRGISDNLVLIREVERIQIMILRSYLSHTNILDAHDAISLGIVDLISVYRKDQYSKFGKKSNLNLIP
jgi:ATP-dependent Clp endopeptidase proteolytic subunit ClpP